MDTAQNNQTKGNYIKPYVILKFGKEIAQSLAQAYSSTSATEKLRSAIMIANITDLKEEARVKYIGDIMTRPKKERMAISRQLFKLTAEDSKPSTDVNDKV